MDQGFTENESSKAIAKGLDVFGGAIVIGTISAAIFLYLQNGTLPFRALVASGILLVSGTFILFCGLFWERIAPQVGVTLTAKLARTASSPRQLRYCNPCSMGLSGYHLCNRRGTA
jgi:hypothetical protein